jgi:hypothetical protein
MELLNYVYERFTGGENMDKKIKYGMGLKRTCCGAKQMMNQVMAEQAKGVARFKKNITGR